MSFVFKNPHPEALRVGDCIKRAIVISTRINYHDVQVMLNRFKKVCKHPNDYWKEFIEDVLGGVKHYGDMQHECFGHRFTVKEFSEWTEFRGRTAILRCSKHLVCTEGGNYYDTWDSGDKGVYIAWWIKDYDEVVERIRTKYPKICQGLTLDRARYRIVI